MPSTHNEISYRVMPRAKALADGGYLPKVRLFVYQGSTPLNEVDLYARSGSSPQHADALLIAQALALRVRAVLNDARARGGATDAIQAVLRRIGLRTRIG
ncbi:hypothetical protein P3W85_31545 [Cupriavidus basilensis]|uniref:Uncharacterized protein n=1 Tax=Cupriavidus basilensis TaxID=68895 RepID=A0ABT6AXU6_9BURK|nr:hypothetical protein [Cupriavidus basilensis]MDF3837451.1 hypothetical protein [Cupriavidus basilensis]